jgi:hypothetical protein
VIRAYAATLAPDDDGTAWIYPGDLAQFAAAHNWAGPVRRPRQAMLAALARLAGRGALDRRPGRASYRTRPPGYALEGGDEPRHGVSPGIHDGPELPLPAEPAPPDLQSVPPPAGPCGYYSATP